MTVSAAYQNTTAVLATSQEAAEAKMIAIASNLSTANTVGFKGIIMDIVTDPKNVSEGNPISFVKPGDIHVDRKEGAIKQTHNTFDVAIQGNGFFQTQGGNYTRNGQFYVNQDGLLTTLSGDPLMGNGGTQISIPANAKDISITADGTVSSSQGILGQLGILEFPKEASISPLGQGLYKIEGVGTPSTTARFIQGAVEESNVDTVAQLTNLIEVQRFFEAVQKAIDAENERLSKMMSITTPA
jgi:flagellar basal-body rod protein FlgF